MKQSISERRGTREECREKRDGAVSDGRDGREKGQALPKRKERLDGRAETQERNKKPNVVQAV